MEGPECSTINPGMRSRPLHAAERRPGDASPARYVGAALLNGAASFTFLLLAAHYLQPHQRILTRANLLTLSRAGSAGLLAGTTAAPRVGSRIAWMALLWGGPSDRYLIPGLLVRYRCPRPTERPWQRTTSPGSDHGPDRRDRTNHLRCGHHPTHTARGSAGCLHPFKRSGASLRRSSSGARSGVGVRT